MNVFTRDEILQARHHFVAGFKHDREVRCGRVLAVRFMNKLVLHGYLAFEGNNAGGRDRVPHGGSPACEQAFEFDRSFGGGHGGQAQRITRFAK